ncbi:hypothetical protein HYFRA_00005599 [Hymenoscyphus fraxineus]|uniref:Jacalin-type lectin domain-containing protein n=1 Tax=Hymenoscyphus fraxineus TaxID=746836 RepID=A0A9N9KTE8_9HELO|nr:hypothetical protein HYFRA_00005599 [Hymenoscyphus fraxineus]
MKFYSTTTLGATAAVLFSLAAAQDPKCDSGPLLAGSTLGNGKNGGYYCDTKWDAGVTVTGITLWASKDHMRGFKLTYSNQAQGPLHGTEDGDRKTACKWDEGDPIKSLKLWKAERNEDMLGWVEIETESGKKCGDGSDRERWGNTIAKTHSGILAGARGTSGAGIDSIEFLFMDAKAMKAEIINLEFDENLDDWNKKRQGITTVSLQEVVITNSNPLNGSSKTYTFENGITKDKKQEITQSYKNTFGVKVGVAVEAEVKVPLFGGSKLTVSTETSYEYETMKSETGSTTISVPLKWTESGPIAPQMAVHCKSQALSGEYDAKYTSTVRITMANGRTFDLKQPGHFSSTGWSSAFSDCKEVPVKNAPKGIDRKEADKEKARRSIRRSIRRSSA